MEGDFGSALGEVADTNDTSVEADVSNATTQEGEQPAEQETGTAEQSTDDLVAELRKLLADSERERNNLKSTMVGRQKAQERDEAVHSRFDAIEGMFALLAKRIAPEGDDPELKAALTSFEQRQSAVKQEADWGPVYQDYLNDMESTLSDGKGGFLLHPKDAPELADARRVWAAAASARDRVGLERALRLAERAVSAAKAQRTPTSRRPALEMAPVGKGAPAQRTQFTREELANMSPEDYAKVRPQLLKK